MTAEIAVMSPIGVALAADSAVTLSGPGGRKIYQSAEKLFLLSSDSPVGVMVYGTATFMGKPWELLVKLFRERSRGAPLATVEEYGESFLRFLRSTPEITSDDDEHDRVVQVAEHVLATVILAADPIVTELERAGAAADATTKLAALKRSVATRLEEIRSAEFLAEAGQALVDTIAATHATAARTVAERTLADEFRDAEFVTALSSCVAETLARRTQDAADSGVVFAGFGSAQILPQLVSARIGGIVCGHLKRIEETSTVIRGPRHAIIHPFAQREMVDSFMAGIDPGLEQHLSLLLGRLFERLPGALISAIEAPPEAHEPIATRLAAAAGPIRRQLIDDWEKYKRERHVQPILGVVASLPKDELAAMAEALVHLTSFKRRVSSDEETVGGPIDVALVTKGDGFIWIKRKHYFRPELNPSFMARFGRSL